MIRSNFNILQKLDNDNKHIIVNSLSGNADILSEQDYKKYLSDDIFSDSEFIEKGYVIEYEKEKKLFRENYFNFQKSLENEELQIFFVPWYECNFNCTYCYQSEYANVFNIPDTKIVDDFFDYINSEFYLRKKYITLFGGEPLLTGKNTKEFLRYFLNKIKENNLEISIVTNGYNLIEYLDEFSELRIREIQVTLDGLETKHNERRHLQNGDGTFEKIVNGIDKSLEMDITLNLRFVCDKANITELPELAAFVTKKGWNKKENFKTQIGRNYELHFCQEKANNIFSRIELYQSLYDLIEKYPEIKDFYTPSYSVMKFLFENGKLPDPIFDDCPGTKTEWAFDGFGKIYSCTATVGRTGLELGTFSPKVEKYIDKIELWQERDITSIEKCKKCNLALICGGGCAAIAFNKNGILNSEDCRPIDEMIRLGCSFYFNE